jgi:hypothetical protein
MRGEAVKPGTTGATGTTGTTGDRNPRLVIFLLIFACLAAAPVRAQVNMPDPRQISGVPLPASDLPSGTVSVRLIRGSFANNLSNVEVTFVVDGRPRTLKTDDAGRTQVTGLPRGATVMATAVVDGEKLETQSVTVGDGGVRFVLAAADPETAAREAENKRLAAGPAAKGAVVLGEESRFIAEFNLDRLSLYYIVQVVNTARTPVDIGGPLVFELPQGARGVSMMDDATKQATANGPRVTVLGPFAPGVTNVNFSFELPYSGPTAHMEQRMPAALQSLQVFALKTGELDISSPQLTQKTSTVQQGQPLIVAMGPAIAAGQSFAIDITGLPHHARWPRFTALTLASAIICVGIWAAVFPPASKRARRG